MYMAKSPRVVRYQRKSRDKLLLAWHMWYGSMVNLHLCFSGIIYYDFVHEWLIWFEQYCGMKPIIGWEPGKARGTLSGVQHGVQVNVRVLNLNVSLNNLTRVYRLLIVNPSIAYSYCARMWVCPENFYTFRLFSKINFINDILGLFHFYICR